MSARVVISNIYRDYIHFFIDDLWTSPEYQNIRIAFTSRHDETTTHNTTHHNVSCPPCLSFLPFDVHEIRRLQRKKYLHPTVVSLMKISSNEKNEEEEDNFRLWCDDQTYRADIINKFNNFSVTISPFMFVVACCGSVDWAREQIFFYATFKF